MNGAYLAAGMFARGGYFQNGEETWAKSGVGNDLAEVSWSAVLDRVFFKVNCECWGLRRGRESLLCRKCQHIM